MDHAQELTEMRRESKPVSTVLRKSVRFFIINIFLMIKTLSKLKQELNTKTFLGEPAPQTPLDSACAFGPRLGNRSVFIPDPHLEMGKGSSDVALFCTFCINPIKNTSSLCLVASLIEKETGATSDGTFNKKLGYLHVQHVLIKETGFFERKHIFHYKSFIGLFVTLLL